MHNSNTLTRSADNVLGVGDRDSRFDFSIQNYRSSDNGNQCFHVIASVGDREVCIQMGSYQLERIDPEVIRLAQDFCDAALARAKKVCV